MIDTGGSSGAGSRKRFDRADRNRAILWLGASCAPATPGDRSRAELRNLRPQTALRLINTLRPLEAEYPGKTQEVELIDFFGRDEPLAHLCFLCAEMLSARVPGKSKRVIALAQLLAAHLVEKYTDAASENVDLHGGLPIQQRPR
jgi:hypothetical protein